MHLYHLTEAYHFPYCFRLLTEDYRLFGNLGGGHTLWQNGGISRAIRGKAAISAKKCGGK